MKPAEVNSDTFVRTILEQFTGQIVVCEPTPQLKRTLKIHRTGEYWYCQMLVRGVRVSEAVGTTHDCFIRSSGSKHLLWIRSCCFELSHEEIELIRSRLPMPVSQ
jgi:hypothetical protein